MSYWRGQVARMAIAGGALFAVFYWAQDMSHKWRWVFLVGFIGVGITWKLAERWWKRRP